MAPHSCDVGLNSWDESGGSTEAVTALHGSIQQLMWELPGSLSGLATSNIRDDLCLFHLPGSPRCHVLTTLSGANVCCSRHRYLRTSFSQHHLIYQPSYVPLAGFSLSLTAYDTAVHCVYELKVFPVSWEEKQIGSFYMCASQ